MYNSNSSLVTGELFLDLEMALYKNTVPSLQTILNLNEIVELVVLKEKLFMPASDHILILKNLNRKEIVELGGNDKINWTSELENLGQGNLKRPLITWDLVEDGVLMLETKHNDPNFKQFGKKIFSKQWHEDWLLKTIGFGIEDPKLKFNYELSYLRGFNNSYKESPNRRYWLMSIKAAPFLAPELKKIGKIDYMWVYKYFKQVEIYSKYAQENRLEFSDTAFMQPFIALNSAPSQNFINLFYKRLEKIRNEEIRTFLELQNTWIYQLPPLTSILLDRCQRFEDISDELIILRKEFNGLREDLSKFENEFSGAKTLMDKLEIRKEFEASMNLFSDKVKRPKGRFMKTVLDFAVDQPANIIKKDFTGPVNLITKKLAEYIYQRKMYPWVNSFADLYTKSLEIKENKDIYKNLFGEMDINYFKEFEIFAKNSEGLIRKNPI